MPCFFVFYIQFRSKIDEISFFAVSYVVYLLGFFLQGDFLVVMLWWVATHFDVWNLKM